jgi:hypothetical protein
VLSKTFPLRGLAVRTLKEVIKGHTSAEELFVRLEKEYNDANCPDGSYFEDKAPVIPQVNHVLPVNNLGPEEPTKMDSSITWQAGCACSQ